MFDYIKKINRTNSEFATIASRFVGCGGHVENGVNGVTFGTSHKSMQLAISAFVNNSKMDKGEILAMFSAISVYNDVNSNYYTLSSTLADYVNKLGVLRCSLSDIIPQGRYILSYRLNGENVCTFVNAENDAISVYSISNKENSIHNGFSNVKRCNEFSTSVNDIDLVNGENVFNSLSFIVKLFQCLNEGVSVDKKDSIERATTKGIKSTSKGKNVKYVSLSVIGETRYNELETALERIKSDSVYSVANWYRRPHYRKGNIFVRGTWCNRKESLLSVDNREIVYTM